MQYFHYLNEAKKINPNENVNKLILIKMLNQDLPWLYANLTTEISQNFLNKYLKLIKKYHQGYPLAYIFGYTFFLNHKIIVNKNVLIPRDETENLVNLVLEFSKKNFLNDNLNILDLGTGSGAIALSLALEKSNWKIIASDVSKEALKVAKKNFSIHSVHNIKTIQSDLFKKIKNNKFDIIVSNPPYIDLDSDTYNINQLKHEPKSALFATENGLFFYHQIFCQFLDYVNDKFLLVFEIGFDQKEKLEHLITECFLMPVNYVFIKDFNEQWRYLIISKKL